MNRLTKRNHCGIAVFEGDSYIEGHNPIEDMIEKLACYEDLEEAGRLIELPCAVGDTVWYIDKSILVNIMPTPLKRKNDVLKCKQLYLL